MEALEFPPGVIGAKPGIQENPIGWSETGHFRIRASRPPARLAACMKPPGDRPATSEFVLRASRPRAGQRRRDVADAMSDAYNATKAIRRIQSFTCLDQLLCMAFAQLTYRESLRDVEACLRAHKDKLYHMGIRGGMSRNTPANANQRRDWW